MAVCFVGGGVISQDLPDLKWTAPLYHNIDLVDNVNLSCLHAILPSKKSRKVNLLVMIFPF